MTESNRPTPATGSPAHPKPRRRRGWRWFFVGTAALVAAATGAAATKAIEHGPFWRPGAFMHGQISPAAVEDRADRMVRHLAIEIDASADQQEKLRTIVKGAVRDLLPLREKAHSARERGRALLIQPTVDRAAIEALRADQMALADQASRRVAQALGDVAEVLTPDQRRKIDDHIQWRRHWGGWHRG
jgi:Spy/CpxP family protein refolding chaperone